MARTCAETHFAGWLDALKPMVVVFIGKAPYDHGAPLVSSRGIPHDFVNCVRNLDAGTRRKDLDRVAALVRKSAGPTRRG